MGIHGNEHIAMFNQFAGHRKSLRIDFLLSGELIE
jgi:hypothetical protein